MLGVNPQARLRIALRHGNRCSALPVDRLASDASQCRLALKKIGDRLEHIPSGH